MPDDLDFGDHAEVLRRVVRPVLAAMYKEGEVLAARVGAANERLVVTIATVDEDDEYDIGWVGSGQMDAKKVAYDLADRIAEYICETSFAWGEQRFMHGLIPGPGTGE
jgi:hypothetical protein